MTSTPGIITATAVTKTFRAGASDGGKLCVLRGVTLRIAAGEIIAIVGASGAGKSTLLHILGTLDRPTSGNVHYDDVDVFALGDDDLARFRNRSIGFVFQFHHLLPEFTALENVAMPSLIMGAKLQDVRQKALRLLREVGVDGRAEQTATAALGR